MRFDFTPQERALEKEILDFLRQELPPNWFGYERGEEFHGEAWEFGKAFARKLAKKGWLTISWPKEYGGFGGTPVDEAVYLETLVYNGVPGFDQGVGAISWIGPTFMHFGKEEQKRRFLPPIARGEEFWCTAYSESNAGSDLAALQTRAEDKGDYFVLNGEKLWSSAAHVAHWCWGAFRTNPDAPKHKGISLLIVDMRSPGVTVNPLIDMSDQHHFNQLLFDNVKVPKSNLIGEKDQGWNVIVKALDFERSALRYTIPPRRLLDKLLGYVREKPVMRPTPRWELTRHRLAERHIEIQASRLLAYRLVWAAARGEVLNAEAAMTKMLAAETMQRAMSTGLQALLSPDLSRPSDSYWTLLRNKFQKQMLHTISSTIAAGTSEINRNVIAQRGLGLPR